MYYTVEWTLILTASDLKPMKWSNSFLTWLTKRAFTRFGKTLSKKYYFNYIS